MERLDRNWALLGARVALRASEARELAVEIQGGRIAALRPSDPGLPADVPSLDLTGHLILPGLINAHDHLEFALFPRLGRGPYRNARSWAEDIYRPDESPIREHLCIPKPQRLIWGGLKNLLDGVTTVCHHNPYEPEIFLTDFPVRVVERYGWAHSFAFAPDLVERFRAAPPQAPFLLHLAEGTDADSRAEIYRLEELGLLNDCTVLIHAVGLDARGRDLARQRQASIVWCPTSNLFTLGQTLDPRQLGPAIPVALGTDSPLTAAGGLHQELLAALALPMPREKLYSLVTTDAARVLRLSSGEGVLREGGVADLLAVRDRGLPPCDALPFSPGDPQLVVLAGEIRLISDVLRNRLPAEKIRGLHALDVEGEGRFWVAVDADALFRRAEAELGEGAVRLAGRPVRASAEG
jgi:cytosine/adenosine deaminase-related metal-dependent hydrolase